MLCLTNLTTWWPPCSWNRKMWAETAGTKEQRIVYELFTNCLQRLPRGHGELLVAPQPMLRAPVRMERHSTLYIAAAVVHVIRTSPVHRAQSGTSVTTSPRPTQGGLSPASRRSPHQPHASRQPRGRALQQDRRGRSHRQCTRLRSFRGCVY